MPEKREKGEVPTEIINKLGKEKTLNLWQISKQTSIHYPNVHRTAKKLQREGLIQPCEPELSEKGGQTTPYRVTFRGFIRYLTSNPQLAASEDELLKLLETYGEILDYALFKETRWLINHYDSSILNAFVDTAQLVEDLQPFPTGAMRVLTGTEKQIIALKKQKRKLLKNPKLQQKNTFTITEDGKPVKTVIHDPSSEVTEELEDAEKLLQILRSHESNWWTRSFTTRIAERLQIRHGKGDLRNDALCKLFKQTAEDIRNLEVSPLEKASDTFKASTA